MNAKQWLILGGAALILLGVLGFIGVIGPTPAESIFGATWYFDNAENWAHLVLGIVGMICAFILPTMLQKYLVVLLGVVGVFFGVYSAFVSNTFAAANLESPADTLLHLVVGIWAFIAAGKTRA